MHVNFLFMRKPNFDSSIQFSSAKYLVAKLTFSFYLGVENLFLGYYDKVCMAHIAYVCML